GAADPPRSRGSVRNRSHVGVDATYRFSRRLQGPPSLTPASGRREDAGGIWPAKGVKISPRMGLRRSFSNGPRAFVWIGLVALLLAVVAWAAPGMGAGGAGPDGTSGPASSAAM